MDLLRPLITVIVPVYNGQDTICDLVESIVKQSYKEWEMILVDDGSTDSSGKLCDHYVTQDNRISVIHQKNMGLSGARNTGINAANGDYIAFVDVDDILLDGYLEAMVNAVGESNEIDLICCGYTVVGVNTVTIKTYNTRHYIGMQEIGQLLGKSQMLERSCVWGRLFRRKILMDNHILFDEKLLNAEDRPFLYHYLIHSRGVATTSYVGYIYGSFSPNSNKNRYYPLHVLEYRQLGQTESTRKLLNHFSLKGDDVYIPLHHLMIIMLSTMKSIYQENGFSQKTVNLQSSFFESFYDKEFFRELIDSLQWKSYMQNNKMMQYMLNGEYWKLNWYHLTNSVNLQLRLYAHNLLKRSKNICFSLKRSFSIINEVGMSNP